MHMKNATCKQRPKMRDIFKVRNGQYGTHLLRSFISWKAFLMCVWLKVSIPPFTVSSSESVVQVGRSEAGVATRLVRHERQCLDHWR